MQNGSASRHQNNYNYNYNYNYNNANAGNHDMTMNGYGNYAAPSPAASNYSPMPTIPQAKPYLQAPVQDPDLLPDNARYGTKGSTRQTPPSDALLKGYSAHGVGFGFGFHGAGDGMGHRPATPRTSTQLDVGDSVAMHLLVETALGDSASYYVLSFDEVERLKRELAGLAPRIEAVRKQLALESKVRDAAVSLNRLYRKESAASPPSASSSSSSSRRRSASKQGQHERADSLSKTEDEVAQSNRKCADLSRDLYQLETRQREAQTRLLMHTAGVLQMTHRGPTEKHKLSEFGNVSGSVLDRIHAADRPDSPESIYTYDNSSRRHHQHDRGAPARDDFDERSLYRTPDDMYGFAFDGSTATERSAAAAAA
ncbi:MAG: hypothetical protein INR71_02065, partial [Terriglobus roseus]|nr:hypothetical protein [Terriglobus roseus]